MFGLINPKYILKTLFTAAYVNSLITTFKKSFSKYDNNNLLAIGIVYSKDRIKKGEIAQEILHNYRNELLKK